MAAPTRVRNTITHLFTVTDAHTVSVGVWMRGRWAIENNGWFMDDWALVAVVEVSGSSGVKMATSRSPRRRRDMGDSLLGVECIELTWFWVN